MAARRRLVGDPPRGVGALVEQVRRTTHAHMVKHLVDPTSDDTRPDQNHFEVFVDSNMAKIFNINIGDSIDIEAYWDEPDPIATVFISGFYNLGSDTIFNNFYVENFQQQDSSFVFSNLIIANEEDLKKLGDRFISMDSDLYWKLDINEEKINSNEVDSLSDILVEAPPNLSSKYDNFSFNTSIVDSLDNFDSNLSTAAIPMKTILVTFLFISFSRNKI